MDKKEVISLALKNTNASTFSGFVAGTLVHTDQGLKPIEQLQAGNMVLTRLKSGEKDVYFKPILNTFVHKNKELWFLSLTPYRFFDTNGNDIPLSLYRALARGGDKHILVTANHLLWVVGQGIWSQGIISDFEAYPLAHWKRIDQLKEHEMVVNHQGIMFSVQRAQPLYQFKTKNDQHVHGNIAWYEYAYYISRDSEDYDTYDILEGKAIDIKNQQNSGYVDLLIGDYWKYNSYCNKEGRYVPYVSDVYNLEVEDFHTCFIHKAGIWVYNLSLG